MLKQFLVKYSGIIFTISLILLLLPLSLKVDFMQNDDWYYYEAVENALKGDFKLNPLVAPILYGQTIFGVVFSLFFGFKNLPVLTLLFSVVNLYLVFLFLTNILKINKISGILLALLFFVNPFNGYLTFGFMTENYFLTFALVGVYNFYLHLNTGSSKNLVISNFSFLFGFLIRQVSLVFYLASVVYFFLKKNYKLAINQVVWFLLVFGLYELLFPKTIAMQDKSFMFSRFTKFNYTYSLFYGTLIYLVAFTLPLVVYLVYLYLVKNKSNFLKLIGFVVVSVGLYFLLNNLFDPESISWGEFPYFENTFERTGFYPRSISGTKYQFRGIFDLYFYWDGFAKILLSLFISYLIFNFTNLLKNKSLYLVLFSLMYTSLGVLLFLFYDRYIGITIPFFILFLVFEIKKFNYSKLVLNLLIFGFVLILGFFTYNFTHDYIQRESFVWQSSLELVKNGVSEKSMLSSSAWNEKYVRDRNIEYIFSYDSQDINEDLKNSFELIKTKEIDFPLNIHINPKVYLYKILN